MAGQSRQALRTRIRSVQSTRKITKAMEMIANAKLFRQRARMESNREYAKRLQETVNEIAAKNPGVESRYLVRNESEKTMTVIFCSDLGLCGGYNAAVLKTAKENLNPSDPVFVVGTSLYNQFAEAGFNLINDRPVSSDQLTYQQLKEAVMNGIAMYQTKDVGKVQILYTKFVNTMSFRPEFNVLVPFTLSSDQVKNDHVETLFEPDPEQILDSLIPMMVVNVAYSNWMESTTSEQGSRRVAMKTASDNADDLVGTLQLEYNKARQASITQEITEIVGGSNAV
ncbi:MAG: ATP synthase F1 subunit gamma [Bulleidia sp.]